MRRETTTLYAVYWLARGVFKVGRAQQDRRWRGLTATGGKVVLMMRDRNPIDERAALAELDATFERAFTRDRDSEDILPRGRGFTECFRVASDQVMDALKTIYQACPRRA